MECYAYPSVPQTGRKSKALCQAQRILHQDDSLLIPVVLLLVAGGAVIYEHAKLDTYSSTSIRNFLTLIIITMLPLAFLEKKILACAEPVSVISKCSSHVLLLHALFLAARVLTVYLSSGLFASAMMVPLLALVSACVLLRVVFGCRFDRATLCEHSEALSVLCFSLWGAAITEGMEEYYRPQYFRSGFGEFVQATCDTAALYVELMAFVPAVWMVCRQAKASTNELAYRVDVADTRKRAVAFFVFLLCFYFIEDVVTAVGLMWRLPLASAGHVAHFLLLLDFSGFLLAHLYDPAKVGKLVGSLRNLWSDAFAV